MNIRDLILKDVRKSELSLCSIIKIIATMEKREEPDSEFGEFLWIGVKGIGFFRGEEFKIFELPVHEAYELCCSDEQYAKKEKEGIFNITKDIAKYIANELELLKERYCVSKDCRIEVISENNLEISNSNFKNYYISIDNDSVSFYIKINLNYEEAYSFFARWFLEERYSENYKTLGEFAELNGYQVIGDGDISKAEKINFNNIKYV